MRTKPRNYAPPTQPIWQHVGPYEYDPQIWYHSLGKIEKLGCSTMPCFTRDDRLIVAFCTIVMYADPDPKTAPTVSGLMYVMGWFGKLWTGKFVGYTYEPPCTIIPDQELHDYLPRIINWDRTKYRTLLITSSISSISHRA